MKTPQVQSVIRNIVVLVAFISASNSAWAWRPQFTPEQVASMQPLDPAEVPRFGNFYLLQGPHPGSPTPPLPCRPGDLTNAPIYALGEDHFLVDDSQVDYEALRQEREAINAALSALEAQLGLATPMGPEGGGPLWPLDGYPSNSLWLSISQITNGIAPLVIHGTVPDVMYEILSKQTLTDAVWLSEGTVPGAPDQDWTPTTVTVGTRTNSLFLRCRSWVSSNGSGIPDWWLLQYDLPLDTDPYSQCPSGDGWTILQAWQNGWNPNLFYTPPTPQGLTATYDTANATAIVSWLPSPGPVTGYTITDSEGHSFNFSPSVTSFVLDLSSATPDPWNYGDIDITIQAQAQYGTNTSLRSTAVGVEQNPIIGSIVPAPAGTAYLAVSCLPPGTAAIRLTEIDNYPMPPLIVTNYDIAIGSFTNGLCLLPNYLLPSDGNYRELWKYYWVGRAVGTNGHGLTAGAWLGEDYNSPQDGFYGSWLVPPFFDGRRQLKENLIFQLRAAVADRPFQFTEHYTTGSDFSFSGPINYAYAGYYFLKPNVLSYDHYLDTFLPFEENYFDRNFVFDPSRLDANGRTTTGVGGQYNSGLSVQAGVPWDYNYLQVPLGFEFVAPTVNGAAISSVLTTNETRWLSTYPVDSENTFLWEIGITNDTSHSPAVKTMFSNARNWFGLPFLSAEIGYAGPSRTTLYAGNSTTQNGFFYPEIAQPQFRHVDYEFWPAPNIHTVFTNGTDYPGMPGLSLTHTNPLLITSVGNPAFQLACYAKLEVTNSYYSGVYGYLQQYFEHALQIATNGVVTTNTTGLLSPYGQFFATEPGPAALVTMPDIDTGQRGTGVVHAIKLQTDVNHDGIMDLSFGGPDNTSQARPMALWVNNDFDRWHDFYEPDWNQVHDQEEDDLVSAGSPGTVGVTPDCDYQWASGAYAIPSKRDLEDYTRLWIPGMKQLYEAHTNLSFELSIRNNDTADGPAINLVLAVESDGGTRYLTDTNVANDQISLPSGKCIGRISPYNTIRLNDFFQLALYPGTGAEHFIWCGARRGKGELVLQVKQGTNLLAETSLWLDLKDIKEMYERWTVGDNGSKPPTNTAYRALEDLPVGVMAFQYGPLEATNTPYILHVHGWNMSRYDKDRYAETAFKRLYWQGYQGRFGEFRWPTKTGFTTFDTSEFNAWKSGEGLYRLITNLNATYPGRVYLTAHSMGNIVAAEALRKAGTSQIVNTYIGMQAAIASHAYDPTTTNRSLGILDSFTYDRHAEYWTNGAPCYLNGVQGASHFANFFNPRDWALSWWETDQDTKPDMGYSWVNVPNDNERYYYQSSPYNTRQLYFPQDTYEIFSFVTEARCYAVGAQTNVAGPFTLSAQVDLDAAPYSFGELHKGHSGEFRSTNMDRWPFWERVLFTMGLKAAQ